MIFYKEHDPLIECCHGVGGVKVSIVAFQAIDPGSIPGWRSFLGNGLRNVEEMFLHYLQVVA